MRCIVPRGPALGYGRVAVLAVVLGDGAASRVFFYKATQADILRSSARPSRSRESQAGGAKVPRRWLVVSAGGGPNGKQRKMMTDALKGARVPVAIVTNSLLMRGAGIAVSWFNPSLKVLRPEDLDGAINYLGLTEWERAESARVLKELEKGLGLDVVRLSKLPPHGV